MRYVAVAALLVVAGSTALLIRAPVDILGAGTAPRTAPSAAPPATTLGPAPARARSRPRRRSVALGTPTAGALRGGVRLPASGPSFRTWDPILRRAPNRGWRRHGTDRLVGLLERVARAHARAHPGAPPMVIGDLSRPRGGDFGARYGIVGHTSHQNGLDADVYYPRRDGRAAPPDRRGDVDRRLARSLTRRFLAAGAERILVSPTLAVGSPGRGLRIVAGHEDHLHVRIAASR